MSNSRASQERQHAADKAPAGGVDAEPESALQPAPGRVWQAVTQDPRQLTSARVLNLQRAVGNRAIGQLVHRAALDGTGVQESPVSEPTAPAASPQTGNGKSSHSATSSPRGSGAPLPFFETLQQSFGHHDLSSINVHSDPSSAAQALALGAEAFTVGADVTFARPPSMHTAAHEATHVIQQRGNVEIAGAVGQERDTYEQHADQVADLVVSGQSSEALLDAAPGARSADEAAAHGAAPARRVLQLRRIPPNVDALLKATAGGPNAAANVAGVERLIELAEKELSPADDVQVTTKKLNGLTQPQFDALPKEQQLARHAEAIASLFPKFAFGSPSLIDTGPRPATDDAKNIATVVKNADAIFNEIASGSQDANLTQVFGAPYVATAKAKYAQGRKWMNDLHAANKIVTDRSGYSSEVSLGGLTGFHELIRLHPNVIDNPDDNDSIITTLHESMHAGNSDVSDDIYINAGGFTTQSAAQKLTNSAHFEVVPWRIKDPTSDAAFPAKPATTPPTFQTFIPAGTTVGTVTAPKRTAMQKGAVAAYDLVREAWTMGLNLHLLYVQLFKDPTQWKKPQANFAGARFSTGLPYWSKVQKLTIHLKGLIDPSSPDEGKQPVSQIDVALSEGLIRKLAATMDILSPLEAEAEILKFENDNATPDQLAKAFPGGKHDNKNAERDLLLLLAVGHSSVAPLTGAIERDLRMLKVLGTLNWGTVLDTRSLSSFKD